VSEGKKRTRKGRSSRSSIFALTTEVVQGKKKGGGHRGGEDGRGVQSVGIFRFFTVVREGKGKGKGRKNAPRGGRGGGGRGKGSHELPRPLLPLLLTRPERGEEGKSP